MSKFYKSDIIGPKFDVGRLILSLLLFLEPLLSLFQIIAFLATSFRVGSLNKVSGTNLFAILSID